MIIHAMHRGPRLGIAICIAKVSCLSRCQSFSVHFEMPGISRLGSTSSANRTERVSARYFASSIKGIDLSVTPDVRCRCPILLCPVWSSGGGGFTYRTNLRSNLTVGSKRSVDIVGRISSKRCRVINDEECILPQLFLKSNLAPCRIHKN